MRAGFDLAAAPHVRRRQRRGRLGPGHLERVFRRPALRGILDSPASLVEVKIFADPFVDSQPTIFSTFPAGRTLGRPQIAWSMAAHRMLVDTPKGLRSMLVLLPRLLKVKLPA